MDELIPKKVETLEDMYVIDVSCGSTHTLCITNEGFVYSWGSGIFEGNISRKRRKVGDFNAGGTGKIAGFAKQMWGGFENVYKEDSCGGFLGTFT
jgi:alpha-tubulin suppressor-like RCC1 family protein